MIVPDRGARTPQYSFREKENLFVQVHFPFMCIVYCLLLVTNQIRKAVVQKTDNEEYFVNMGYHVDWNKVQDFKPF